MAYDNGEVTLHTASACASASTTTARADEKGTSAASSTRPSVACLISEVLPRRACRSDYVNKTLDKKALSALIDVCYRIHRNKETVLLADRLRTLGFEYATRAGISICMDHMVIPRREEGPPRRGAGRGRAVIEQYQEGLITDGERYNKIVDIWAGVADKVTDEMMKGIGKETVTTRDRQESVEPSFNPIYIMADSGARGSTQQIRQLAAMRGLMAKPSGEIIETPITANFREGLTVLQYFISTHGARKGLADTALKTANSGYLTRRLVDVAQDAVISRVRLRHARRHPRHEARGGRRGHPAPRRPHPRPRRARGRHRPAHGRGARSRRTPSSTRPPSPRSRRRASRRSSSARCSPARRAAACAPSATAATSPAVTASTSARRSASSRPVDRRARHAAHDAHVPHRRRGRAGKIERASSRRAPKGTSGSATRRRHAKKDGTVVVMNRHGELVIVDDTGREREHHRLVYGAVLKVAGRRQGQARPAPRRVGPVRHADPHRGRAAS
jgi:DNA-directed RNA polymerase subunit beta'